MMDALATVQRSTKTTRDVNLGQVQNFVTVAANVPCSVQQAGAHTRAIYGQQGAEAPTTFYFYTNPLIEKNDLLTCRDWAGTLSYYVMTGQSRALGRDRIWTAEGSTTQAPGQPQ